MGYDGWRGLLRGTSAGRPDRCVTIRMRCVPRLACDVPGIIACDGM